MLHCWAWVASEKLFRLTPSGEYVTNPRPKPKADQEDTLLRRALKVKPVPIKANKPIPIIIPNGTPLPPTPPADDTLSPQSVSPLGTPSPLSPPDSGRSTPAPYQPDAPPPRAGVLTNLFKSCIVFAVSGLHHDCGSFVMLLDAVGRGEQVRWRTLFSLSPFFIAQPFALAVEAIVKKRWRKFKHTRGWAHNPTLTTFERVVGFIWTWVWLGWTAGWFVEGMSRLSVWHHWPGKTYLSALWWVWGL